MCVCLANSISNSYLPNNGQEHYSNAKKLSISKLFILYFFNKNPQQYRLYIPNWSGDNMQRPPSVLECLPYDQVSWIVKQLQSAETLCIGIIAVITKLTRVYEQSV